MNWLDLCSSFVCVAETGGIRAASRRLQVTPMAISKQIKQLEQRLGQALFRSLHQKSKIDRIWYGISNSGKNLSRQRR